MVKYLGALALIFLLFTGAANSEPADASKIDARLKTLPLNRREVLKFINPVLEFTLRSEREVESKEARDAVIARIEALAGLVPFIEDKDDAATVKECLELIKKNVAEKRAVEATQAEVAHLALDMIVLDFIGEAKPEEKLKALRGYFVKLYATGLPDDRAVLDKAFK